MGPESYASESPKKGGVTICKIKIQEEPHMVVESQTKKGEAGFKKKLKSTKNDFLRSESCVKGDGQGNKLGPALGT